jgi:hypothetical protein
MELVRFIYCQIFELAAYATGRAVVTILSGGRVRVQKPIAGLDETFPWHGVRRDSDGTPVASVETAELIGVLTWVLGAIAAVLTFGRL